MFDRFNRSFFHLLASDSPDRLKISVDARERRSRYLAGGTDFFVLRGEPVRLFEGVQILPDKDMDGSEDKCWFVIHKLFSVLRRGARDRLHGYAP